MKPSRSVSRHEEELKRNLGHWKNKPILRKIYREFHKEIAKHLARHVDAPVVELGSGIGNIKETIPGCIRTDLFPNPWIDQVENAYRLSFGDHTVSNLILFDVFHHLEFPGSALAEFHRVVAPEGRVIIFDPCVSLLGLVAFGLFHHEPLALTRSIQWRAPSDRSLDEDRYYAAQGNAYRVFFRRKYQPYLSDWKILRRHRISAISYIASGGYSKPSLYPAAAFPLMRTVDRACDRCPWLFASRLLVVLEKASASHPGHHGYSAASTSPPAEQTSLAAMTIPPTAPSVPSSTSVGSATRVPPSRGPRGTGPIHPERASTRNRASRTTAHWSRGQIG